MDSLPLEIKLKIFNQLFIRDSIKCRQVCKEWLTIIDCLRYKTLNFRVAIYERSEGSYHEKNTIDLWILNFEKFLRSVTIDPKFCRIKVMNNIDCYSDVENFDVLINNFHELEELNLLKIPGLEKLVLNLKYLKKIRFIFPPNQVKLETPSLAYLMTRDLSNFEICYPEKIKCLVVNNTLNLSKFKNLEILSIMDYYGNEITISQLSVNQLHRLTQLKRVYAGSNYLTEKIDQIPINRNSELQVYYYGFRINSDLFGNFDWTNIKNSKESYDERMSLDNDGEWISFMARNYSKSIDDNPYIFHLDYTRLLNEFDQNVPKDFLKKISNFDSITISNLDDEIKILKFLDSVKPRKLFIENATLSRSFLEQLSKLSFIQILKISIDKWPAFLDDFNFDFKNEEIYLTFEIHCSLKSLRPAFKIIQRAKSIQLRLLIFCDEFNFVLLDYNNLNSSVIKLFSIDYYLNDESIRTSCSIESSNFCFHLNREVPSIVEMRDKLRLFFIVKEYEEQIKIAEKVIRKFYGNPIYSIKF